MSVLLIIPMRFSELDNTPGPLIPETKSCWLVCARSSSYLTDTMFLLIIASAFMLPPKPVSEKTPFLGKIIDVKGHSCQVHYSSSPSFSYMLKRSPKVIIPTGFSFRFRKIIRDIFSSIIFFKTKDNFAELSVVIGAFM